MNAATQRTRSSAATTGVGRFCFAAFDKWPAIIGASLLDVTSAFAVDTITTRSATAGNPAGAWSNTSIWSEGQVPTNIGPTTWHVIVPSGVPITQVDGDYTINRLDLSGSIIESLDAGHLLTVVNELNVNGGILRGPGTTLTQGQTTWAGNGQINANHVLQNWGPFSVVDFLIVQSGGLFENLAAGAVTLQSDFGTRAIGGANRNAGTYNLSVTSPFASVSVSEMETTSTGVVNVLSGPVSLTNPRQQSGTFNIANIASVSFANNNPAVTSVFTAGSSLHAAAGSSVTLSGLSRHRIDGLFDAAGSVTASAQEVEWTSIPANVGQTFTAGGGIARFSGGMPAMNNLSFGAGTLTGLGNHQISGTLTSSGTGVLAGNGTSTLASGGSASGTLTIDQRKLIISAGATSTLSATLINNGELQNLGTVTNADFLRTSSSTGTFRNDAAYNVTSNLHRVDAIFAGSGTTTIASGATLAIERDASGAQQFIINSSLNLGTTNPFAPVGTRTFDAGSSFTGPGSVTFGRGTTNIAGNFALGGPVTVEGGTANFTSAVNTISDLRAGFPFSSGGTFNFNGGLAQIGTLQLGSSGILNITGNTAVTGTADFIAGTHGGSGVTTVQGMARLGGTFDGRRVDFQNNVVPAGGGFSLTNNATIRVAPGAGRLNLDGFNVNVNGFGATPGQLVNAGVIDNTHPSFPNDTFLFRVDVPFVQEATGRIDNGHDLEFRRTVNAAGGIVLTRPEAQLLLQAAGAGVVQTFTGPISGPGSILINRPPAPPANVLRVNFDGGLDLSDITSELRINNAEVTLMLNAGDAIAPETVSRASGDGRIFAANGEAPSRGPIVPGRLGLRYFGSADATLRFRSGVPGDLRIETETTEYEKNLAFTNGDPLRALILTMVSRDCLFGKTSGETNLTVRDMDFKISTTNPIIQNGAVNFTLGNSRLYFASDWTITDNVTIDAEPGSLLHEVRIEPLSIGLPRLSMEVAEDITFAVSGDVSELKVKEVNFEVDGTVDGNLQAEAGAKLSGGSSPGDGIVNGNLTLIDTGTLLTELAGTQQGVTYDFVDLNGTLSINGGLLELTFLNGFQSQVQPSDVFTVLDADSPIIGSFANVASGGQLLTSDGLGFFNVYYGPGSPYGSDLLVVTNFVPEPAAAALIVPGSALLAGRRRRN